MAPHEPAVQTMCMAQKTAAPSNNGFSNLFQFSMSLA
eukprot:CAMPEP_0204019010 /NCGR_PEP_ID=MMETSP0360-20130528/28462_1 /ASSEMBLY_ACC=CAM_ASM_000342 /TAXON_ID=268821 /ORGANISM="Scrippsiella Hangoei, Strain SHTV-5" /LENGTH=36 /DNA_ID= /DNA_START= /DNA_END= /DNA_ORIENTATION=